MLKLAKAKQAAQAKSNEGGAAGGGAAGVDIARRRVQWDLDKMEKQTWCKITFPQADNLLEFTVTILPDEGFWKSGKFEFSFSIPSDYPHSAPKLLCRTKVFHPNIDNDGKVCLNILREDWKPVLDLGQVINGLLFLFLEPNPDDPLNKDAANLLRDNRNAFQNQVIRTMRGGYY